MVVYKITRSERNSYLIKEVGFFLNKETAIDAAIKHYDSHPRKNKNSPTLGSNLYVFKGCGSTQIGYNENFPHQEINYFIEEVEVI